MDRKLEKQYVHAMRQAIKQYDAEHKALKAGYQTVNGHRIAQGFKGAGVGVGMAMGSRIDPVQKNQMKENMTSVGEMLGHDYDYKHPEKWIDQSRHMPSPPSEQMLKDHEYQLSDEEYARFTSGNINDINLEDYKTKASENIQGQSEKARDNTQNQVDEFGVDMSKADKKVGQAQEKTTQRE